MPSGEAHEVYLLMLRQAAGTHTHAMQSCSGSRLPLIPRSILAHAQASCWHTHTPCSHARVLGCRSSHEVYLLILGPAVDACPMQYVSARAHAVILEFSAGTHTVPCRRIYNAQTIPTYRRKPMNIADRLWRHADRLWACRRLREAEACLLSCLRVSDTNIHHVSYETKEAV